MLDYVDYASVLYPKSHEFNFINRTFRNSFIHFSFYPLILLLFASIVHRQKEGRERKKKTDKLP